MLKKQRINKIFVLSLAVCLIFTAIGPLTTNASAAGDGYSDAFRIYELHGLNKKTDQSAVAMLYGSATNKPEDNYAVILKTKTDTGSVLMNVMDGKQFEAVLASCISTSQTNMSNLNEYLLSNGVPDEFLALDQKPYIVTAIQRATSSGQKQVTVKDETIISLLALKYAAKTGGNDFRILFDSMDGKSVNVRITVTASKATKGIIPLAYTYYNPANTVIAKFSKHYTNKFALVDFLQEGSFGTNVRVSAKVDLTGINTKNLVFYHYDIFANKVIKLENTDYKIDNGWLYFTTGYGGSILITDKEWVKR